MNSNIPMEMAFIFFLANCCLKQGIGLMYVMVDFFCMSLLDYEEHEPRITKWRYFAHSGIRTRYLLFTKRTH